MEPSWTSSGRKAAIRQRRSSVECVSMPARLGAMPTCTYLGSPIKDGHRGFLYR